MPPKVTDTRPTPEALHAVEEKTAAAARRIVATYSQDFMDGVTLMCMLGVEPNGLVYKKVAAELEETEPSPAKRTRKATKKTTTAKKAPAKKATKKTTAKKTAKKV
ncbi:hypothetical protein [Corynebacterium comes]|uniref:Histone n=1 Tax=Corynebacterium comes TaxID=2675218 RepID=A0A6B8VR31_9CORY|nr:hypothetical protein [Corynebacterium comes]QGU05519.1 hypothetical protein CETAM_11435 [Corynebacterium comes]